MPLTVEPSIELLEEAHRRKLAVYLFALSLVLDEIDERAGDRQDDFVVALAEQAGVEVVVRLIPDAVGAVAGDDPVPGLL